MLRNVALKSLRDIRRGFLWWSLGLIGFVALIVSVYPTVHSNPAPEQARAGLPEGAAGVHRLRRRGRLRVGRRVSRDRALLADGAAAPARSGDRDGRGHDRRGGGARHARAAAREPRLADEGGAREDGRARGSRSPAWASCSGSRSGSARSSTDMDISAGHLAAATLSAVLLALAYGAIAVLLGAATGRRTLAIGVTAAAAVAAYLVNGLAPLVHALKVPQKLSPFYHYAAGDPLRNGVSVESPGRARRDCRRRDGARARGSSPAATSLREVVAAPGSPGSACAARPRVCSGRPRRAAPARAGNRSGR